MKFRSVAAGSAAGIAGDPNGGAPAGGGGGGGAKQPLAEAATVWHVLTMMVMHLARKVLFGLDISLKVSSARSSFYGNVESTRRVLRPVIMFRWDFTWSASWFSAPSETSVVAASPQTST